MVDILLTVGTRKGLFIGRRRRGTWEFDESPYFNAQAVYAVAIDTRTDTPRLPVGGDSAHWGPSVFHSDDLGRTWTEPAQAAVKFPKDTGASLERVWQLHPSTAEPEVVFAGAEPAALFRSADHGESFELVRPLWEHPTRDRWVPGGGRSTGSAVRSARRPARRTSCGNGSHVRKESAHPEPDTTRQRRDQDVAAATIYGSRQSTGCVPCRTSRSLARLNGREPKKPRSAAIGEG